MQYVHPQRAGAMEKERKTIVHAKDVHATLWAHSIVEQCQKLCSVTKKDP